jgi:hypothetical protein
VNGLSPETVQMLLARRNPELTQALVRARHATPEQAAASMGQQQQIPQGYAPADAAKPPPAVLNGQPTAVAGDAVLAPLGSGQSPITPYHAPDSYNPLPYGNSQAQIPPVGVTVTRKRHPGGNSAAPMDTRDLAHVTAEAEAAPSASINDQPAGTQGDTVIGPPQPQPPKPGFFGMNLPSFGQMGSSLSQGFGTPAQGPQIDYTNLQEGSAEGPTGSAPAPRLPPSVPVAPPPPTQAEKPQGPPTPGDVADAHFRQNAPGGGGGMGDLPPAQVMPAHTLHLLDPATEAAEREGLATEREGRVGEAQADVGANTEQARILGNQAGTEMISQVQEESKARHIRWLGEQHANEMEQDRLEMAKDKPDYNRIFRGRPVLGIMAAVAQALGAVGSAITHTPNAAAQIIQDRVDRDVMQQRADYEHKKESLQAKSSIFAEKMKLLGDPNAAEEAAKAHGYNAAMLLAKREAANANSPVLQARATTVDGVMQQKIAEKTAAMQQRVQAGIVGGVGAGSLDQKLYVPRAGGVALREKDAEELTQAGAGYAKLESITNRALALRQQIGLNPIKDVEIFKELHQLQAQAQPAIQETNNFKRLSAEDEKVNSEMLGAITGFSPGTSERLARAQQMWRQQEQEKYKAAGIAKSVEGYSRNARGEVIRKGALTGQNYTPPAAPPERRPVQ